MSTDMGTAIFGAWSCTVRLVVADDRVLDYATADLINLLGRVDAAASRFRARLRADPGQRPAPADPSRCRAC